ncbi:MAG: hypothetical protein IJL94_03300 [Erysipelotrichaceae bacterium]|nr:hypothetical protein [Erysipelotrichaceae bacterium]
MKKVITVIIVILIFLTGFIDTAPDYSAEQIDERYNTNISSFGYPYKKEHHYSITNHSKVEYVFRGTKQYSRYTHVIIRVADSQSYITSSFNSKVRKTIPLSVNGYNTEIRVFSGHGSQSAPYADVTIKVNNGYVRVEIAMSNSMDQNRDWEKDPLEDSAYLKIFEDLLTRVLIRG